MTVLTFGHGTADQPQLEGLLQGAGVTRVVDVRRFPASRRHPHVNRPHLADWLSELGITYRWEERLGGRRRSAAASPHTGLRNASFRAYADHMESSDFADAIGQVVAEAAGHRLVLLCAEAWWVRCHRRLIADHLGLLAGADVQHLGHTGRLEDHVPTDVVRVEGGRLLYDNGARSLERG